MLGRLRAASEVFTHVNPAKGIKQYFVRFVRFAWDYNSCVLFGRCTQRPYPLTTHYSVTANMLFAVFEYKGLWPDNRKYVLLFFCQKISLLIAQKPLPIPVFADGGCVWDVWIPRVQEPAAIRPYGHRVLQTPLLIYNYGKEKTSGRREHK